MKQKFSLSLTLGVSAYLMWGLFPLYFSHLSPAKPLEAIVHRAAWGLLFCLLYLAARKRLNRLIFANKRDYFYLIIAGLLITTNWTTYVFTVLDGNTIAASIGYFINPLITVALGVVILRESLRFWQWVSLGIGALAVVILVIGSGELPWVSLVLALTFGLYGLCKKQVNPEISAVAGMAIETATVTPVLLVYYVYLLMHNETSIQHLAAEHSPQLVSHVLFLVGAGAVTMVPLVLFGMAAYGLPLRTIGMIQYISPILQFSVGLFIFHEEMSVLRWVAMIVIWFAVSLLTVEGLIHGKRSRQQRVIVPG